MPTIATWNINSIRARLPNLLDWLKEHSPDILLLQETKCMDDQLPREALEDAGYNVAHVGQKTYNGVAILSKTPLEDVITRLPGEEEDEQARYIEAITVIDGLALKVASVYVPNGSEVGSEKFAYKLRFMRRLIEYSVQWHNDEMPIIFGGDYNIAPYPQDVYNPTALDGTVCYHPQERALLREWLHTGWVDAFRTIHPDAHGFSWWDYRAGCWQQNKGMRIDHLLLNPAATDHLAEAEIDKTPRDAEKASDHAPVWCRLHPTPNRVTALRQKTA